MKIFLVTASSGVYEDYRTWIVAGFEREEDANAAKEAIVAWYAAHPRLTVDKDDETDENAPNGPWGWWKRESYRRATCPFDPEAMEHNGAVEEPDYGVQEIDVWDLDAFLKRRRPALRRTA